MVLTQSHTWHHFGKYTDKIPANKGCKLSWGSAMTDLIGASSGVADMTVGTVGVHDTPILTISAQVVLLVASPGAAVVSAVEHQDILAKLRQGKHCCVLTIG